tara:strand:- start:105072 stop:105587 length:516 start_codon:yes stop_codon:yes gene_type:complete
MKIFIEEQRFTQLWLHILLAISFVVSMVFVANDWYTADATDSEAKRGFFVLLGGMVVVYGLIFSLKLKTRIDEKGIYYQFIPFHFSMKLILWRDLENAYVRKYDAISEYGGWGIKGGAFWRKSKGVAYNVKGDLGLQLTLKTGKKILIGTQKEHEIKRILSTYYTTTNDEN